VVLNVARGGFEGGPPSTPRLTNEAGKAQAGFAVRVRGLEFVVRSSEAHYFCMVFLARSTITFKPGKAPAYGSIYIACSTSRPVVMPDGQLVHRW
jgi:hypothetical protein